MAVSEESRRRTIQATERAKKVLKRGDRIRAGRCGGIFRTYTFDSWDGMWIVTKSGICDIAATAIDRLNGVDIDFSRREDIQ